MYVSRCHLCHRICFNNWHDHMRRKHSIINLTTRDLEIDLLYKTDTLSGISSG